MDLGNMRHLGVRGLAVHCLNAECRHEAVFSADDYPDEVEVNLDARGGNRAAAASQVARIPQARAQAL